MSDYQEAKKQEVRKSGSVSPTPRAKEKIQEKDAFPCPNCGASIPDGALFCPECGVDLNTPAFCPNCGAKTSPGADICQVCKTWLLEDQCKFCYAQLPPDAVFCPECGNSKDGIQCPNCGTLSIFGFCTKCRKPLSEDAIKALELAKNDPAALEMIAAFEQVASIESELAELETLINSEPSPEDAALPTIDSMPPIDMALSPVRKKRFSDRQMAAIMKTDKNMEEAALRRDEAEKKALEDARKREEEEQRKAKQREEWALKKAREQEEERQARIREAIVRQEVLDKQKEKALAAATAELVKYRSKQFSDHQKARDFHNALRPDDDRVSGWLCNFTNTVHPEGPNECGEPRHGGCWYRGKVFTDGDGLLKPCL